MPLGEPHPGFNRAPDLVIVATQGGDRLPSGIAHQRRTRTRRPLSAHDRKSFDIRLPATSWARRRSASDTASWAAPKEAKASGSTPFVGSVASHGAQAVLGVRMSRGALVWGNCVDSTRSVAALPMVAP
ncbi:protein of unknown function [Paraburkholderia dioscoreae]|uniref:Uncharacterized protein n=1 Tax=Paraburkholderia dioscoreae TaxID=2604047 RepID=A0A5Q4ZMN1_9BURK|nr:protein of unknown function [Paraburkholderia dioscoreae]